MAQASFSIREATAQDVPLIARFIRELATYEKLAHEAVFTEEDLRATLFGDKRYAEVLIAEIDTGAPAGFALFFHNYSTFLGRPGLYLEDLFVSPEYRGLGIGKALLQRLAQLAIERKCSRMEWSVLDWNEPAIEFYRAAGARAMDEWTVFRLTGEALQTFARRDG